MTKGFKMDGRVMFGTAEKMKSSGVAKMSAGMAKLAQKSWKGVKKK